MMHSERNGYYLLRLMPGEELIATLEQFCRDQQLTGGFVAGLGATNEVELAHFNVHTKEYSRRVFSGEYEVVNLTGNISAEKLHIHMTIGDNTFTTFSGHCLRCVADPTLEIMITPFAETHRAPDNYSGLQLLNLGQ
jgi:predicted DNA-binding protein with PD1-like motif